MNNVFDIALVGDDTAAKIHSILASNEPIIVLRVARFMAQLGNHDFTVTDETMQLLKAMTPSLNRLTYSQIWEETELALQSTHPERFFETLQQCGALQCIMPELYNLIEVPQPIAHHPENFVFTHIMLALQQAVILSKQNPIISFSVLMHDLGKAVSPKDTLPSHPGHEDAGVPLVTAFCERFAITGTYRDIALKVTQYHLKIHRALELRASSVVNLFVDLNVLTADAADTLELILLACKADATGRLGLTQKAYPQADYLRKMHAALISLDTNAIIEKYKMLGDAAIGNQIRNAQNDLAYATARQLKKQM